MQWETLYKNSPPPYKQGEETQKDEKEEEFTCEICIEPTSNKFKNGDKCAHPFCIDCMIKYIRVKLDDDNDGHIMCPAVNCDNVLDPFAWAPAIGAPLFVRWCDVLCQEALVDHDHCYCPNLNCNVLIVNECGGNPKKSECPSCKSLFCFRCKRVWHEKFSCRQNADLTEDANDIALMRLAEHERWIRCPRCKHLVAKGVGCVFVKCRCGAQLCYDCGSRAYYNWCPKCNHDNCFWESTWLIWIYIIVLLIGGIWSLKN